MDNIFKHVESDSLKERVITQFEELILSGQLPIGSKLPSERDLAAMLGVGRPLIHEALSELHARDLVSQKPRGGTVVNDFRKQGSLALLATLVRYKQDLEPHIMQSIVDARLLFETECARLAATNRSDEQLAELERIILLEKNCNLQDVISVTETDFNFHLQIAIATNNFIYPLLINSFKGVYTHFSGKYFSNTDRASAVFNKHEQLYIAIKDNNSISAEKHMKELLLEGADSLTKK